MWITMGIRPGVCFFSVKILRVSSVSGFIQLSFSSSSFSLLRFFERSIKFFLEFGGNGSLLSGVRRYSEPIKWAFLLCSPFSFLSLIHCIYLVFVGLWEPVVLFISCPYHSYLFENFKWITFCTTRFYIDVQKVWFHVSLSTWLDK